MHFLTKFCFTAEFSHFFVTKFCDQKVTKFFSKKTKQLKKKKNDPYFLVIFSFRGGGIKKTFPLGSIFYPLGTGEIGSLPPPKLFDQYFPE